MGSCVSKKAARAGARGKVAAPLPVVEKENAAHAHQLPPVLEVEAEVEEVKEVVLSETPRPPRPLSPQQEPVKRRKAEQPEADDEAETAASETCSGASDSAASSVVSAAKEKAELHEAAGWERERELEKRAVDAPEKAKTAARRTMAPEESQESQERESRKLKGGGVNGHGRARSPSPSSAHSRQQHPPAAPRPRREQPAVVSGIGCRSGRFSPSAARRAAAVRRTHSAREADMALPQPSSSSKRSLSSLNNGNVAGCSALSRRDPGERSGRRSESPTGGSRRAPAIPHRAASPMRKAAAAAKERHGTPERARPAAGRGVGDDGGVGGEQKKVAEGGEDGAPLGHNNPSVAMECFIFL